MLAAIQLQSMAVISWRSSVPTEKPRPSKLAGVGAHSIRSRTSTHSDITKNLGTLYSFDERFAIRYLLCGRRVVSATSCPPENVPCHSRPRDEALCRCILRT